VKQSAKKIKDIKQKGKRGNGIDHAVREEKLGNRGVLKYTM